LVRGTAIASQKIYRHHAVHGLIYERLLRYTVAINDATSELMNDSLRGMQGFSSLTLNTALSAGQLIDVNFDLD
jgi:hypothetical protein